MATESRWEAERRSAGLWRMYGSWGADRARREGYAHQAALGQQQADLSMRNQQAYLLEQARIADEREINRLKREEEKYGPRNPAIDDMIKTGSFERLLEKAGRDPNLAAGLKRVFNDPTLRPNEQRNAAFLLEIESTWDLAVQQHTMTPQQRISEQIFVFKPEEFGLPPGPDKVLITNGKGGHIIDTIDTIPTSKSFKAPVPRPEPMGPIYGPEDYGPPEPQLLQWNDGAWQRRAGELMAQSKVPISPMDAMILAEMDRYTSSGVSPDYNPTFAAQYNEASARVQAAHDGAGERDGLYTDKDFENAKKALMDEMGVRGEEAKIPTRVEVLDYMRKRRQAIGSLNEREQSGTIGEDRFITDALKKARGRELYAQFQAGTITEAEAIQTLKDEFQD